ncbi:MAG: hypothetical protein JOY93_03735 [Acidobacteriales bacterium]|nr:hypothetical protein [Terriglobales bacterium]
MNLGKIFAFVVIGSCLVTAQQMAEAPPKLKEGFDVNAIDKSVDPCVNFYQYACGTWRQQNPVPPDKSIYGRFSELADRNRLILKRILESASAADSSRSANDQKIGDYYASCMDESAIEQKGTSSLQPEFDRIAALSSKNDLPALMAHYSLIDVNAFFSFGSQQDFKDSTVQIAATSQGGFGLPERDFYFRDDPKSVEIRKHYVQYMQKMLELFGESSADAARDSATAMEIETSLARGSLDNVSRRNPAKVYHRMSLSQLDELTPSFNWNNFATT